MGESKIQDARYRMFTRLTQCGGFTRPAESAGGQDVG